MRRITQLCSLMLLVGLPSWPDNQEPEPDRDLTALSLEQLMDLKVEGAARHLQSLQDAPASVTVITAQDIRKYGYRTLGEALASARGFYTSDNRTYRTAGVRGFNLPWDYASRILVMVNGHNMADSVFDSMLWFGPDFPIEMSLVKRIEIIRGPSSSLYGSNGVFATINVVTISPGEAGPPALIADAGSFGEKKAQAMAVLPIGREAKMLFSGSVFNNSGESPLFFPEFNSPQFNNGQAIRMDGQKGYHFFSNLVWRNWSFTVSLSNRNKTEPISWGYTVFNDRGTHVDEDANYVEALYTKQLSSGLLRWRSYYNSDHLAGRFDYALDSAPGPAAAVEDNRTRSWGDWVGSELTYRFDVEHVGTLTAGTEVSVDLRTLQSAQDVSPVPAQLVHIDQRERSFAVFVQDERKLSPSWKLDLGIRLDASYYRHSFVSPRAALIYQPSAVWTYKFLYGRAFRNPSAFDLFYGDNLSSIANPKARPEKIDTVEVDVERKLGKRMNLIVAGYSYWLKDFLVGVYTSGGLLQTQNEGQIHATGLEVELNARPTRWLDATSSYAFQKSSYGDPNRALENSPEHLAKLRFAVPVGRKFDASSSMQYYSSRRTLAESMVGPVYLADFTITSKRLLPNFDIQFGIRNAFNRRYSDPIALNGIVNTMSQPGRSFFVELTAHAAQ